MFVVCGSRNNKTTMDNSTLFSDIQNGKWPPSRPTTLIAGRDVRTFHYLADKIYPKFSFLALPHPNATAKREGKYSAHHGTARKAGERVFGVMFKQFIIMSHICRLAHVKEIEKVALCCCILPNIISKERSYKWTIKFCRELQQRNESERRLEHDVTLNVEKRR